MDYERKEIRKGVYVIVEAGRDYSRPVKAVSFAFDTETHVLLDGRIISDKDIYRKTRKMSLEEKRARLSNEVWAWLVYDEANGFFLTNDFNEFLTYLCRAGACYGWCYNATFDFAQIDYEILCKNKEWKPHEKRTGGHYDRGQRYAYESVNNDMGTRYAYKLWFPYKNKDGHEYVHAVELRDFMKFCTGGLAGVLENLDITDADGKPIRKLEMDYQKAGIADLTNEEIAYCVNDVKGLYYAVKKMDGVIADRSEGELRLFGEETNLMTAGGLAKRMLLKKLYPNKKPKYRLKDYQRQHPITKAQDKYFRENKLYAGGISFVNPAFKGKMIIAKMNRYDVNSEYPYAMSIIRDLVGAPFMLTYEQWLSKPQDEKENYECIYGLTSITGRVKPNYLGLWRDPFKGEYVDLIDEEGLHLIYEREFNELMQWYEDVEYSIDFVILFRRGGYVYKPFVDEFYAIKAQAKQEGNKTLQQFAKLILNSCYGKLAERIERGIGHYEENPATGCVHFVRDGVEEDSKSTMSVAVGALVTATARVYILSKIREICAHLQGGIKANFVYIDTDSIHTLATYDKADAINLGGLKLEATCEAFKYLLPKTYIDIERIEKDGTIEIPHKDKDGKKVKGGYEVHSKGINSGAFSIALRKKQKGKKKGRATIWLLDRKMNYGALYVTLQAMNVKGGKVLVPTEKYIARKEQAPCDLVYTNYEGEILIER